MSSLYIPFRSVGHVSHGPAFVWRINKRGYVATTIGSSFQIYDTDTLHLKACSPAHKRIAALCCMGETTFTAAGSRVLVWVRARLARELIGHATPVRLLVLLDAVLVSVDSENELLLWDATTFERLREAPLRLGNAGSRLTCLVHPLAYLNKVLFGSESGQLFLWNIRTGKLLFTFPGWGSPVTCLAQSPALDVVAVGLADGRIILLNIKSNEVIMTLRHANSSVTSLTFRSDVTASRTPPTMVSGDSAGIIVVWNLEKRVMVSLIKHAHRVGGVSSLQFLQAEPVLVSSGGADNSLKMWIFDSEDGSARLLRERSGHTAPPRVLLFSEPSSLFSGGNDGAVRLVSIIQDHRSHELSQKALKKVTRKTMTRLPPVSAMSYSPQRRKDWVSLVTAHAGLESLWGWKGDALGNTGISFPSDRSPIRSCAVTHCGNFALVGTANGGLHKVNLQSGRHVATIVKAHSGPVEGVVSDIGETVCISCGLDGYIRFWDLSNMEAGPQHEINAGTPLATMTVHHEGGLFVVSGDDWVIRVYDIESRSLAREFRGHSNQITALTFSGNAKWVVSASADSSIRTWDIVSSHCIDGFYCPKPAVALAFSPDNDMLASAHLDDVGMFLWSNRAHFSQVFLRPFDAASMQKLSLPSVQAQGDDFFVPPEMQQHDAMDTNEDTTIVGGEATSAGWEFLTLAVSEQESSLVAQSGEPEAKFLSLVHIEEAKERNKPIQPPTKGTRAPFALPTISTLEGPKFVAAPEPEQKRAATESRILEAGAMARVEGPLSQMLREGSVSGAWEALAQHLRSLGPSSVDLDIRMLSLEKDCAELKHFVSFLLWMIESHHDFDLVQGYLFSFLNAHGEMLLSQPKLKEMLKRLHRMLSENWNQVSELMQRNSCYCALLTKIEKF